MKTQVSHVLTAVALSLLCTSTGANGIYDVTATVQTTPTTTNTTTASFSSAEDLFDSLRTGELSALNPGYTGTQAATLTIGLRGLPIVTSYPQANSTTLVFTVPSLGITETFTGATRNDSEEQLVDFLKNNVDGILDQLFKELAKVSPVDPIAGNPNSLMSQLVAMDYATGAFGFAGKKDGTASNNLIGVGAQVGSFDSGGFRSNAYTVPLSYTMRADLDPRRQVSFNLPLTYIDVEGSHGYSVAPSISYRQPINDNWALSPAIGVGVTGSLDLASYAAMGSVSLTSSYVFSLGAIDVTIGNMVGYYTTLEISAGDYSANPGIANTVAKNGIAVSYPIPLFNGPGSVEFSYANTHFWGTDLYSENYNEFGLAIATRRSARDVRTYFRAGAAYINAGGATGFTLNVGYWF